jgi:hypothetical protein
MKRQMNGKSLLVRAPIHQRFWRITQVTRPDSADWRVDGAIAHWFAIHLSRTCFVTPCQASSFRLSHPHIAETAQQWRASAGLFVLGRRIYKFPLYRLRAKFKSANIFLTKFVKSELPVAEIPVDLTRLRWTECGAKDNKRLIFLSGAEILIGHVIRGTPWQSDDGFRMEASSGVAYLPKDQRQIPPQRPLPPTSKEAARRWPAKIILITTHVDH